MYAPGLTPDKISPAWLQQQLYSLSGAKLTGLWLGEDLGAVGSDVLGWPSRTGNALINRTSAKFGVGSKGGHRGLLAANTTNVLLSLIGSPIAKSVICVADTMHIPTSAQYGLVTAGTFATGPYASMLVLTSGATWYASSAWTHFLDGAASENLVAGVHVYQADKSTNDATGIGIGSWATDPPWPNLIFCALTFSTALGTSGSAIAATLRKYYSSVL